MPAFTWDNVEQIEDLRRRVRALEGGGADQDACQLSHKLRSVAAWLEGEPQLAAAIRIPAISTCRVAAELLASKPAQPAPADERLTDEQIDAIGAREIGQTYATREDIRAIVRACFAAAPIPSSNGEDAKRLLFVAHAVDGWGDTDVHETAHLQAARAGRDQAGNEDYLAAVRIALDAAMAAEAKP